MIFSPMFFHLLKKKIIHVKNLDISYIFIQSSQGYESKIHHDQPALLINASSMWYRVLLHSAFVPRTVHPVGHHDEVPQYRYNGTRYEGREKANVEPHSLLDPQLP